MLKMMDKEEEGDCVGGWVGQRGWVGWGSGGGGGEEESEGGGEEDDGQRGYLFLFTGIFWVWKMKGDEGYEEEEQFLKNLEKR